MKTENSNIIKLTNAAADHIASVIAKHMNGIALHLSVKQTGCSGYMYVPKVIEKINSNDVHVMTKQNINIYLDPDCIDLIKGTTINYVNKSLGMQQLEFNNPNAESLCGCGESFNLKVNEDE